MVRSLPTPLANFLQYSLPHRPAALELLFTQGRIIGRNHKRDLFVEIDRFKRACTGHNRSVLQELWNWVNSVQFPPNGTHAVDGRLTVLATRIPVRGHCIAFFSTERSEEHTRGSGATPEAAIAELAKLYQIDVANLHTRVI